MSMASNSSRVRFPSGEKSVTSVRDGFDGDQAVLGPQRRAELAVAHLHHGRGLLIVADRTRTAWLGGASSVFSK